MERSISSQPEMGPLKNLKHQFAGILIDDVLGEQESSRSQVAP